MTQTDDPEIAALFQRHFFRSFQRTAAVPSFMQVKIFDSAIVADWDGAARIRLLKLERAATPSQKKASTCAGWCQLGSQRRRVVLLPDMPVDAS